MTYQNFIDICTLKNLNIQFEHKTKTISVKESVPTVVTKKNRETGELYTEEISVIKNVQKEITFYLLFAYNNNIKYECECLSDEDKLNFEENYKDNANNIDYNKTVISGTEEVIFNTDIITEYNYAFDLNAKTISCNSNDYTLFYSLNIKDNYKIKEIILSTISCHILRIDILPVKLELAEEYEIGLNLKKPTELDAEISDDILDLTKKTLIEINLSDLSNNFPLLEAHHIKCKKEKNKYILDFNSNSGGDLGIGYNIRIYQKRISGNGNIKMSGCIVVYGV